MQRKGNAKSIGNWICAKKRVGGDKPLSHTVAVTTACPLDLAVTTAFHSLAELFSFNAAIYARLLIAVSMASALFAHVEVVGRLLVALEGAELARVSLEQSREASHAGSIQSRFRVDSIKFVAILSQVN